MTVTFDAFVGDLGKAIPLTARCKGMVVDLTGATLDCVYSDSPDGARAQQTNVAVVSAAAGTYVWTLDTLASELTAAGSWKLQLQTTEGTEVKLYDTEIIQVGASLANSNTPLRAANPMVWGRTSMSVAGNSNVTPTAAQYSNFVLHLTGALTGNIAVIVPTLDGAVWLVSNATTGAFTATVRTSAGTGPTVTQGQRMLVYCDGTNIVQGASETL